MPDDSNSLFCVVCCFARLDIVFHDRFVQELRTSKETQHLGTLWCIVSSLSSFSVNVEDDCGSVMKDHRV